MSECECVEVGRLCFHTHTHTHTLSHSHSPSLSLTHSHTHTLSLSLTHSLTHPLPLSLCLSLSTCKLLASNDALCSIPLQLQPVRVLHSKVRRAARNVIVVALRGRGYVSWDVCMQRCECWAPSQQRRFFSSPTGKHSPVASNLCCLHSPAGCSRWGHHQSS